MNPLLFVPIVGAIIYFGLPRLLQRAGLHPHYEGQRFNHAGKRALIVTTSQDTRTQSGKATGVWASEMTVPYYEFLDAKMQIDVASIEGGNIPIEAQSIKWPVATDADKRFLSDSEFQRKVQNSLKIDDVDATSYDVIFLAGGWGAAYDLGYSEALGQKTSEAYANGAVLGAVCHGSLGLLKTRNEDGSPLLKGLNVTGVSDKQIRELGITETPQHPETELRRAGAIFHSDQKRRDALANLTVVDGRIVTGQNQNAGTEAAQKVLELL